MADDDVQKRLIRQWRETGRVLREIRLAELAAMREEESRQVALDILNLLASWLTIQGENAIPV